jgi:hypothetical protein
MIDIDNEGQQTKQQMGKIMLTLPKGHKISTRFPLFCFKVREKEQARPLNVKTGKAKHEISSTQPACNIQFEK